MTFAEAARLLLMGGILAVLLRSAWSLLRSSADPVIRIATVWAAFVLPLIGARVGLTRVSDDQRFLSFLVRLQDFTAIAPIPFLLSALGKKGSRRSAVTTALVVATSLGALWVWLDGPVLLDHVVTGTLATGETYRTLATGPLLRAFGAVGFVAWLWSLVLVMRDHRDHPDLGFVVAVGGGTLVLAGANDSLMDAGVIRSVPLIDVACLVALVIIGVSLSRRTRAAFSGARDDVERHTRELERHHDELSQRERATALGALAGGLGHEINNPLTVVALSLDRAVGLLQELDRLAPVRLRLEECQEACRSVANAVQEFGSSGSSLLERDEPRQEPPSSLRILVVDDEPLVAKSLRRALAGHQVTVAHGGTEALAAIRAGAFDRVLCDVMMPGMSGPELYRALEADGRLGEFRFAFVTGGAFSPEIAARVRRTGVPVLRKPVDPRELARFVRDGSAVLAEAARP
jgi:CheY-like chemotaxis protein